MKILMNLIKIIRISSFKIITFRAQNVSYKFKQTIENQCVIWDIENPQKVQAALGISQLLEELIQAKIISF